MVEGVKGSMVAGPNRDACCYWPIMVRARMGLSQGGCTTKIKAGNAVGCCNSDHVLTVHELGPMGRRQAAPRAHCLPNATPRARRVPLTVAGNCCCSAAACSTAILAGALRAINNTPHAADSGSVHLASHDFVSVDGNHSHQIRVGRPTKEMGGKRVYVVGELHGSNGVFVTLEPDCVSWVRKGFDANRTQNNGDGAKPLQASPPLGVPTLERLDREG
jgi:hypothetical protein